MPANAAADPGVDLSSVSCASAGDCSAAGQYTDSSGDSQGLLLTESSGTWATGVPASLPGNAVADPNAAVGSVSCPAAGECAAVGAYDSPPTQGLLLSAARVSPTLAASAPASATAGSVIPSSTISARLAGGSAPIGTVTFTVFGPRSSPPLSCASGGTTVGSASVSGDGTYHPSAGFTAPSPGDYWWHASYTGDPSDGPPPPRAGPRWQKRSRQAVRPSCPARASGAAKPLAPALSAVKLASKRFTAKHGTTIKLTVSEAARVRVLIAQTVKGRKVKHACKRNAKTGRRCTITITKRALTFSATAGANALKLKLKGLVKGSYTATITAENPNGKSRTVKLKFTITRK